MSERRIVHLTESRASRYNQGALDCGDEDYDTWLATEALPRALARDSTTYLMVESDNVVGYFTLALTVIEPFDLSRKMSRGRSDPIAAHLLAKLAVTRRLRGTKAGPQLLRFALTMLVDAHIPSRLIVVDAERPKIAALYEEVGFGTPSDRLPRVVKKDRGEEYLQPRRLAARTSSIAQSLDQL